MAAKNAYMNRLTVELLKVQPDDRVLEIGFGPGTLIHLLAKRATNGFVAGIDISELMVKQASRRNRKSIQTGRVELRQGTVSSLPYEDGRFTKICTVNTFHHWPSLENDLREVRRVLDERGLLFLCLRMKHPSRKFLVAPGFTEEQVEEAQALVRRAGFCNIRTERRQLGREITCVMANR
jgi:ubiquinone/menaquinone biosynthesis C-methylase UbiE